MILYLNKNSDISKTADEIKIMAQEYKDRSHIRYPSTEEKKSIKRRIKHTRIKSNNILINKLFSIITNCFFYCGLSQYRAMKFQGRQT